MKPFGDAADEVVHLRARHAPHGLRPLRLAARLDGDLVIGEGHVDLLRHGEVQLALGPLHGDALAVDLGGDALGYGDGLLSDA